MEPFVQFLLWTTIFGTIQSQDYTIRFFLYTTSNPTSPQELVTGNLDSVMQSYFNSSNPTRILIHGWTKSAEEIPNPELRSAYLAVDQFNVISVDWKGYASLDYYTSRYKVDLVGATVADFIDFLSTSAGLSFSSLVVIGHSLGAHCAGFAGKFVKQGRLPYIVGLDPAAPLFWLTESSQRLHSTDADYVETIHTNGLLKGIVDSIGSASFYANWGFYQPGCGFDLDGTCSHARAVLYYADAIRGYTFTPVKQCQSISDIIYHTGCDYPVDNLDIGDPMMILRYEGIFYFETNSEEPFGH